MVDLILVLVLAFLVSFAGTLSAIIVTLHFWLQSSRRSSRRKRVPVQKSVQRRSKKGVKSPTSENVTKVLK